MTLESNPTADRISKLGTKRHILIDNKGIPLCVVISSAITYDVKLVIDMMDNMVIKRRIPSARKKDRRTRKNNNICLDKADNSKPKEQEIVKRGYVLHLPYERKRGVEDMKEIEKISNRKRHPARRWVVWERTNSWHNRFRKLFTRYEKKVVENYLELVHFSCCMIIYRKIILGKALNIYYIS